MKYIPLAIGSALSLIVAALVLTHPDVVQAQTGGLVPCTGGTGDNPCDFCDLEALARNIINFLIAIFSSFAALMFAYAGFLLLTGSTDSQQISKAKGIFWNVLIGLVIVLAAWLIVDTIMKGLVDEGEFGPWNSICTTSGEAGPATFTGENLPGSESGGSNEPGVIVGGDDSTPAGSYCARRDDSGNIEYFDYSNVICANTCDGAPNGKTVDTGLYTFTCHNGSATGDTDNDQSGGVTLDTRTAAEKNADELGIRNNFESLCELSDGQPCITVNKNACGVNQGFSDAAGGCTDVSRMDGATMTVVQDAANECNALTTARGFGAECRVVITGGSELGHACAAENGTHCSGDKVDIRPTGDVNRYVTNPEYFEPVEISERGDGYRHKENGSVWFYEIGEEGQAPHWDVVREGFVDVTVTE